MRIGDKRIAVDINDLIPESIQSFDWQYVSLECIPIDYPSICFEDSPETCLESLEKFQTVFCLPVQYHMNMIAHQFECDDPDFLEQYCCDSKGCHCYLEVFFSAKEILHDPAVCIQMPEWSGLLKDSLTFPFFFCKCQHRISITFRNIVA